MCVCVCMGDVCVTWNKNTVLILILCLNHLQNVWLVLIWFIAASLYFSILYFFPILFHLIFHFFCSLSSPVWLLNCFQLQRVTSQELINLVRFHAPFAIIVYILNLCWVVSFLFLTRMTKIYFKKSGCDGFPLWQWALILEIQHKTTALNNVIRSTNCWRASEKKCRVCVKCSYCITVYVTGSNKEYFEFEFEYYLL